MTIQELKDAIKTSRVRGEQGEFAKGYNMALGHAVKLIEMYEQQADENYPLGRNDWQE